MTKFNPDFWEVSIASESWQRFSTADQLAHRAPEEVAESHRFAEKTETLWPEVRAIMDGTLTERQRQIVRMYFFEQLNQRQIAERLGISQQSVSEHLYGKVRDGHTVGGAMRKLRKACADRGVRID